jgi:hypothetical protein
MSLEMTKAAWKPKRTSKPFQKPTLLEFTDYGRSKEISEQDCLDQYEIWNDSDWCDGNGTPIKSWKGKLTSFKKIHNLPSDKRAKTNTQSHTKPTRCY